MTYTFEEKIFKQEIGILSKYPLMFGKNAVKRISSSTGFHKNCTFECRLIPKGEGFITYQLQRRT